jgi:hypothetical protein
MPEPTDEDLGIPAEVQDVNIRAEMRKRGLEAQTARSEADSLRRELAITKAGIPDTPVGKFFVENYSGDIDPTAIKTAFDALGVQQQQTEQTVDPNLEAMKRQAEATGSASPGGATVKLEDAIRNATNTDEVMALVDAGHAIGASTGGSHPNPYVIRRAGEG